MKFFLFVAIAFAGFSGVIFHGKTSPVPMNATTETVATSSAAASIVFVGDIMPGRYVETLSERFGFSYPYASTTEIFSGTDAVFGNLEGPIPLIHKKTPVYGYGFSFSKQSIIAMRNAGISIVSLANNHTADLGSAAYDETTAALDGARISFVGDRGEYVGEWNGEKVRFIGVNDTFAHVSAGKLAALVREKKNDGVFTVIAIHWGDEYKMTASDRQREIAHALIDAGADLVIGTHPHIAQDIETYKGRQIFYSLGNFIFDQYFSEETQMSIAVKMTLGENEVSYDVIPIDLHKSRPRIAAGITGKNILLPR